MLLSANPYIIWDVSFVQKAFNDVIKNVAATFNVGIYAFVIISGVVLIVSIVWGLIK